MSGQIYTTEGRTVRQAAIACLGLIAADIRFDVTSKKVISVQVGGSAFNVCANLKFLGVKAVLVGLIGSDSLGNLVLNEAGQLGIDMRYVKQKKGIGTPLFVEMVANGVPNGEFRAATLAPYVSSARFKAPPFKLIVETLRNTLPKIIYTNKQIRGLDSLSDHLGSALYYEPDCLDDKILHKRLCMAAQIVKFSHHNFIEYSQDAFESVSSMLVETFGSEGISIRNSGLDLDGHYLTTGGPQVIDATGAGDWLTAGMLYRMARRKSHSIVREDICFALKLARISCSSLGARGLPSYSLLKTELRSHLAPHVFQMKHDPLRESLQDINLSI